MLFSIYLAIFVSLQLPTYLYLKLRSEHGQPLRNGAFNRVILSGELLIGFFFLLPIRLALMCVAELLLWLMSVCVASGISQEQPRPIGKLQRALSARLAPPLVRLVLFCAGFLHIRRRGKAAPGVNVFVAAPHTSLVDGFIICSDPDARLPGFLVKQTTMGSYDCSVASWKALLTKLSIHPLPLQSEGSFSVPFFGTVLRALQCIPVARGDRDSRKAALRTMIKRYSMDNVRRSHWPPIVVFPEGTTTDGKSLLPFHSGAFSLGQPVQPVILRLSARPSLISHAEADANYPLLVLLMLLQLFNEFDCEYMQPIKPTATEQKLPQMFADRTRAMMQEMLLKKR